MKRKVIVVGANGAMGQILCKMIEDSPDMQVVAGVDKKLETSANHHFRVCDSISMVSEAADVIVDFSSPKATHDLLEYAKEHNLPVVIATTGHSNEEVEEIYEASREIPVFYSSNMSFKICILKHILIYSARLLAGDEIEITEEHHSRKADSPSGTAKMLANAINEALNEEKTPIYGRTGRRKENEIGISSIRCGNIFGTHTVIFGSEDDTIRITHTAHSRKGFATGALRAARFVAEKGRTPGLYDMDNLFNVE